MTKPKERGKPVAGAPGWMLTLGDMNTLLLTFFVILVSMLSWERPPRAPGDVPREGLRAREPAEGLDLKANRGAVVRRLQEATQEQTAERFQIVTEGRHVPVSLEGPSASPVITLGGEYAAFDEGDYRLMEWHCSVLDVIRDVFGPFPYVIVIRAHTSGWKRDSVVALPDGSWVSYREAESLGALPPAGGDHVELAFLRAVEVRRFLATPHAETGVVISPSRMRVEAVADRELVADEVGYAFEEGGYGFGGFRRERPTQPKRDYGGPNRRVEIVIKMSEFRSGE